MCCGWGRMDGWGACSTSCELRKGPTQMRCWPSGMKVEALERPCLATTFQPRLLCCHCHCVLRRRKEGLLGARSLCFRNCRGLGQVLGSLRCARVPMAWSICLGFCGMSLYGDQATWRWSLCGQGLHIVQVARTSWL